MFDTVGRAADPEGARRNGISMMYTVGMMSAGLGFLLFLGAKQVVDQIPVEDDWEMAFPVTQAEPEEELKAPALPPPAGGNHGGSDPLSGKQPPRKPQQTPSDNPQLPSVNELVPDDPTLPGTNDEACKPELEDCPGASGPGPGPGTGPGPGGSGNCEGPDCPVGIEHGDIPDIKRQVPLKYPEVAKDLNIGTQRCIATVTIDQRGVPYSVTVDECPMVFHKETKEGLLKFRWYAFKDAGVRHSARFRVGVTYELR